MTSPLTVDVARADNQLMIAYLLARGLEIPPQVGSRLCAASRGASELLDDDLVADCLADHWLLCQAVRPASPMSLRYLSETGSAHTTTWGLGVPLVRRLMAASVIFMITFTVTATSSHVSRGSGDIFASTGFDTAVNELFLLSAAGIGASFAGLFKANVHVSSFTYEPRYEPTYWARLLLGLIAGLVLAEVIPLSDGDSESLSKPVLALLGGFSAELVYSVMTSLIALLGTLVQSRGGSYGSPGQGTSSDDDRAVVSRARLAGRDGTG